MAFMSACAILAQICRNATNYNLPTGPLLFVLPICYTEPIRLSIHGQQPLWLLNYQPLFLRETRTWWQLYFGFPYNDYAINNYETNTIQYLHYPVYLFHAQILIK